MAVTTKKTFAATTNATTTVFSPVSIQLNNQDDLDVYVTLSGGTRVLQLRQSTGSTAQSSHPQVNNTDGLYFPAVSAGTTLYNYQLSTDNNTITFSTALPTGATVFVERRTRDADSSYTTFASGSTIRATDLNNSSTESNFTAQDARNKALTIEGVLFRGDQASTNFVTTDHIVNGTIVEADIANSAVTQNKLATNSVGTPELINGSVTTDKLANDNVTLAKLGGGALPTDITVASANIVNGTIATADIGGDQITNALIADNQIDSEHYVDGSIDHVHLANDIIDGDNIQDDVVNSEHIVAGALDNEHYAAGSITSDKLSGATVITESEQAAATTNDTSFLTSAAADARFFNISSGDTIKDGDAFPDNDTTIATTAAINDRIIDLVDDVGGFVPIANETSFPTSNPDVNNGSGTLVSIKSISSTRTPSSGTVTIANGAGSGNTVSITGCGSTILTAGFGVIVETTSTLHTYAFHRLVPKATEVTTVAGISSNVTTVATNIADNNKVADDLNEATSEIDTVATNIANVNNVGNSIANVNTTAGSIANVNTTAGSITNVNNVGNNISNVNAVAGNASNINSAVSNASNINSAVSNASNITTVAGSIANVNTTAGSISNVNTVASNINSVNNFFDVYRTGANNPTTSLDTGDLFFNTTSNSLKVYTGSAWVDGVTAAGNFAVVTGNTFTGSNTHNDNVKSLYGAGQDLQIFHNGTENIITTNNSAILQLRCNGTEKAVEINPNNNVELYYDNSKKFETLSTGVKVTGQFNVGSNLTVEDAANVAFTHNSNASFYHRAVNHELRNRNNDRFLVAGSGASNGVALYHFNGSSSSEKFKVASNVQIPADNVKLQLGASQDLQLFHNGTHSNISNLTGTLRYLSNTHYFANPALSEVQASFVQNSKCELRFDNAIKFETSSTGTLTTGQSKVDVNTLLNGNTDYNGQNFGLLVSYDGGDDTNDEGNGICFAQQYTTTDTSTVRTGAIVGYKSAPTGGFGGGLKFKVQQNGASTLKTALQIDSGSSVLMPNDNSILKIGANLDLQIYHDGSDSRIKDLGTGDLIINASRLQVNNAADTEAMINAVQDGAVELYHNNVKRIETTSYGNEVFGHFGIATDNNELRIGGSYDLRLYHNGTNSYIDNHQGDLFIRGEDDNIVLQPVDGESAIVCDPNGSVNLYYDNNLKFQTKSYGALVSGGLDVNSGSVKVLTDGYKFEAGASGDLQMYHDGTSSILRNSTGIFYLGNYSNTNLIFQTNNTNRWAIRNDGHFIPDADSTVDIGTSSTRVRNFYADTLYGNGANLTGIDTDLVSDTSPQLGGSLDTNGNNISFTDSSGTTSNRATFGTGNDLQIYHQSNVSHIAEGGTGPLRLSTDEFQLMNVAQNETMIYAAQNLKVALNYDGSTKLETVSNGVQVNGFLEGMSGNHLEFNTASAHDIRFRTNGTLRFSLNTSGHLVPYLNNTYDLGTASNRFRNVYTGDLQLSNEGSVNDVDGTWGNYTMQEGENDLYLINNRSGKKYKFNLTEVS